MQIYYRNLFSQDKGLSEIQVFEGSAFSKYYDINK